MMSLGFIISVIAGGYAVGAVIQPDITRYSRSKGHAAGGMVFGMMGFIFGISNGAQVKELTKQIDEIRAALKISDSD